MSFLVDTGSTWTWLPTNKCPDSQCSNDRYFYQNSQSFDSTGDRDSVKYGIGEVGGEVVVDDFALTDSDEFKASDVNFLAVDYAKDLTGLRSDGLLGLSPRSSYPVSRNSGHEMHLLVDELHKDGKIDSAMFSVYLTFTEGKSKI